LRPKVPVRAVDGDIPGWNLLDRKNCVSIIGDNRGIRVFEQGIQFLFRGGPTMVPLVLCAIVSVAVMIERYLVLEAARKGDDGLMPKVRSLLESGRDEDAYQVAISHSGPVAKIAAEAIRNRNLDPKLMERRLEELALVETPKLSQRLNVLDTVITISPLLGLLGTVTGMIGAFHIVGDPNATGGPAAITGNVAEALIATATGLAIAIVTLVGYNSLGDRVKSLVASMELAATQILNIYAARESADQDLRYEVAPARV
jgi:biopolymer transport protein ExbB